MSQRYKSIFSEIPDSLNKNVNPYVKKLIEGRNNQELPAYYGSHLKDKKGFWREFFKSMKADEPRCKVNRLFLEIGVHTGKVINELAAKFREDQFIGVDITYKRVVLSAQKAKIAGLDNLVTVLGDARYLDDLVAPEELDGIIAFFPDPWIKKKSQLHNRLFNHDFCKLMHQIIKINGFFWLKTDSKSYYEQIAISLKDAGFSKQEKPDEDLILNETAESTFESLFKRQNLPIYESVWFK